VSKESVIGELPALECFREVNGTYPETTQIHEFKAQGGKVLGWLCTYVPEELLHAAGALPVRITGYTQETELDDGNAHLYVNNCSFSRSCLQMGLRGQYAVLDGVIAGSTCDGARRLFDHWSRYIKTPFARVLTVPRKTTPPSQQLYYEQVQGLKNDLEAHLGISISDARLQHSISVYNRSRELLRQLYDLRKRPDPPISGAETLEVLNASFRMPKEMFNDSLSCLLREMAASSRTFKGRARLMLVGSVLNNHRFIQSIEDQGGLVVADELCTSTRYWSDPVIFEGSEPPLQAIARRYLSNFPCARMFPSQERFARILNMVRDFRVEGVVSETIRYCVPYAHDLPPLRDRLAAVGVPTLALDVEYGTSGSGQVATRVQAFLEMIEVKKPEVRV
jgi:bzd-type benzoyl-CoA reductase N subunit